MVTFGGIEMGSMVGRRGLVGLFVMYKSHGAKGRRFESRRISEIFQCLRIYELRIAKKKNCQICQVEAGSHRI